MACLTGILGLVFDSRAKPVPVTPEVIVPAVSKAVPRATAHHTLPVNVLDGTNSVTDSATAVGVQ